MRAFSNAQCDAFLSAFGQKIQTSTGSTFIGIVEVLPVSIEAANGFIESTETYVSMKKSDLLISQVSVNTKLNIESVQYTVYNIIDDLPGIVEVYYRTIESSSFAEDY